MFNSNNSIGTAEPGDVGGGGGRGGGGGGLDKSMLRQRCVSRI